jgi:cell division protein FtsQ
MAILSRPGSGVAKSDASSIRASVPADDPLADEYYRPPGAARPRAARPTSDEDKREEETFLRTRRRVPVRQGWFPATTWGRILAASAALLILALLVAAVLLARIFLYQDARFRVDSSANIQIVGSSELSRGDLLEVFGADIGRNIFFVPLKERRKELELVPWVEHATVMRLLPNQVRVTIIERTPVAFVRQDKEISLVDENGVILGMPPAVMAQRHYSFPVVTGIVENDPLAIRTERMKMYRRFLADLDSGGEKISAQLSEVDLSHPEDIRVLLPEQGSDILAHFGNDKFLARYRNYKAHIAEWRQQYPHLASVDLRYDTQVVLEMAKGTEVPMNQNPETKVTDRKNQAEAPAPPAKLPRSSTPATKAHSKAHHPVRPKG